MPKLNKNSAASPEAASKQPKIQKISLGEAAEQPQRSVMQELRANGAQLALIDSDAPVSERVRLAVKFPGMAEQHLSLEDLRGIRDTVNKPIPEGDSPSAVFARTFSQDSTGLFSARFSDADRARTLSVPGSERDDFLDYIQEHIGNWGTYLEKAEAAVSAPTETPAAS